MLTPEQQPKVDAVRRASAMPADLPAALAWFCAVSLIACMLGVGCWAVLGRVLRRWLRTATRQRWFNRSLALVLLGNIAGMLA